MNRTLGGRRAYGLGKSEDDISRGVFGGVISIPLVTHTTVESDRRKREDRNEDIRRTYKECRGSMGRDF